MTRRLDLASSAPAQYRAMVALDRAVALDPVLRALIKVRASQINGCAYCIDMHWKDARAEGEREDRLFMLNVWPESALYTDREKAALQLCEAMTLISEDHVPDAVWDRAAALFDDEELAQLMFAIAAINSWNRIAITSRVEPGHHRPRVRTA